MRVVIKVEGHQPYETYGDMLLFVLNSELEVAIKRHSWFQMRNDISGYVMTHRDLQNGVLLAEFRRG